MFNEDQMDRDNLFHERINVLKDQGYRGFSVASIKGEKGEFNVTASNEKGRKLTANGETKEEAYKKLVDLIDNTLDEGW